MAKECIHIHTLDAARMIAFPFPVHSLGYIPETLRQRNRKNKYTDKIEFCIRLGSRNEHMAVDELDGKSYRTPFPHLIIKPPGVVHSYAVAEGREAFYFFYSASLIPDLQKAGIDFSVPIWPLICSGHLLELIHKVKSLLTEPEKTGVIEQIDLTCFAILEELLFVKQDMVSEDNFYKKKIYSIATHLRLHHLEHPSIDELVVSHGLSLRNFYRLWRTYFSDSPLGFIQELKLQSAENDLLSTDRPVSSIAAEAGFDNVSYFIKLFRRKRNITPHQFRLKHMNK